MRRETGLRDAGLYLLAQVAGAAVATLEFGWLVGVRRPAVAGSDVAPG